MFSAKGAVESNISRVFWNDGLLDILAGLGVLLIGVAWQFDLVVMGAVAPALLVPLWKPLRQKFTEPNLGYVEFSDRMQSRNRSFLVVAIGLGILTTSIGVAVYFAVVRQGSELELGRIVQGLPVILLGILSLMTAQITLLNRFFGYAALLTALGVISGIVLWGPAWSMLVGGTSILFSGFIVLYQFQRSVRTKNQIDQESKSNV